MSETREPFEAVEEQGPTRTGRRIGENVQVPIQLNLSLTMINQLIFSGIERAIGNWATNVKIYKHPKIEDGSKFDELPPGLHEVHKCEETDWQETSPIHCIVALETSDKGHEGKTHFMFVCNKADEVITLMSKKYPKYFAQIFCNNWDAETADVFAQCCIFGEVVYS